MDRYHKVEKPKVETPIDENEIRITSQGRMRSYISYAMSLLQEKGSDEIVFKAMGRAINKTVTIVELIKRRIVGLHQITAIQSTDITDTWEPLEEGLQTLETTRKVSMITIVLSKKELDKKNIGYQLPIPVDQVKVSTELDFDGDGSPHGRGRGGRFGRGRGRPRAPPGNDYAQAEYEEGGFEQDSGYYRGRGRGRGYNYRGRGGYNGPPADNYNDNQDDYNYRFRRGRYNGPQVDNQYDAGGKYQDGYNYRGRGRGGFHGPQVNNQYDAGNNNHDDYNYRGRRGRYNGPRMENQFDERGNNQDGYNYRGRGRGGYHGPQVDNQYDAGNNDAPRGRGRGRGTRGRGRGFRTNDPYNAATHGGA